MGAEAVALQRVYDQPYHLYHTNHDLIYILDMSFCFLYPLLHSYGTFTFFIGVTHTYPISIKCL
jgi:hypothetical protein